MSSEDIEEKKELSFSSQDIFSSKDTEETKKIFFSFSDTFKEKKEISFASSKHISFTSSKEPPLGATTATQIGIIVRNPATRCLTKSEKEISCSFDF